MNSPLSDDIDELKRLLAEQEALNRTLLEKLADREREIDTESLPVMKNACYRQSPVARTVGGAELPW